MQNKEQIVANNLGTIIANQALTIATQGEQLQQLTDENSKLRSKISELNTQLNSRGGDSETTGTDTDNR